MKVATSTGHTRLQTTRRASKGFASLLFRTRALTGRKRRHDELAWVPWAHGSLQPVCPGLRFASSAAAGSQRAEGTLAQASCEQFCAGVTRAATAVADSGGKGAVQVVFGQGCLAGVSCRVFVKGRIVRCRMRVAGAAMRRVMRSAKARLVESLAAGGFGLEEFEVSQ